VIADIRFPERIRAVFEEYRPEIVFHAAAHKHVPLMESNEVEAVTNNVLGTRNVVEAAVATGAERFLMISTDKAVNPTSPSTCSGQAHGDEQARGGADRAGRGAADGTGVHRGAVRQRVATEGRPRQRRALLPEVYPERAEGQIASGGPVTVTHREVKRYFMPALSLSK